MAKQRATTGNDQLHLEVPDENDVGIDPHKKTLTASILDRRGGTLATETSKSPGSATGLWRTGRPTSARYGAGASRGRMSRAL